MVPGLEPTETIDSQITVVILDDPNRRERRRCQSYADAIAVVKAEVAPETVTKIENRDGDVVFTSEEMAIEDWESQWEREKRRLSVDVEAHDCPYNTISCVADDLCVRCKMDAVQNRF